MNKPMDATAIQVDATPQRSATPTVSPFLLRGFLRYLPRMLRKNFNAFRVAKNSVPDIPPNRAVICYMNHPGWWDPLVAFFLNQAYLGSRTLFAPIDSEALKQYPVFRRLGFYGVDMNSHDGTKQFLTVSRELLKSANTAIWITPGGKFADPRVRTELQPGLAHVVVSWDQATVIPVAVEYSFWEERTPELLVEFGPLIQQKTLSLPNGNSTSKSEWQHVLSDSLAATQASLAQKVIARDYDAFETMLDGSAGAGGLYDSVRRLRSWFGLGDFQARHRRVDGLNSAITRADQNGRVHG